jgi:hypothetical protein
MDIAELQQRSLPQVLLQAHHANLASYLAAAPLSELAHLAGALGAECSARGIQVAEPLGLVAARLEYCEEVGR